MPTDLSWRCRVRRGSDQRLPARIAPGPTPYEGAPASEPQSTQIDATHWTRAAPARIDRGENARLEIREGRSQTHHRGLSITRIVPLSRGIAVLSARYDVNLDSSS